MNIQGMQEIAGFNCVALIIKQTSHMIKYRSVLLLVFVLDHHGQIDVMYNLYGQTRKKVHLNGVAKIVQEFQVI